MALSDATLLGLELIGGGFQLSEYAARGIQAKLQPISAAGQQRRDVNGTLVDISNTAFRKFRLELSCDDMDSPGWAEVNTDAPDGVWPGAHFVVTLIPHLGQAAQMVLTMAIMDWSVDRDEWGAATSWAAQFEEV